MPEREEAGTVRSVERALAILDLLGQHQALGLEELHYLTELPKATVSRLLHTLLEQGWLYRGLTDRRYRLRSTRLYGDAAERFRCQVVERSAPLLVELSERTGLVADLSILDGDRLLVAESSVPGVLRTRPTGWWSASTPACSIRPWARPAWANWQTARCAAWRASTRWTRTSGCAPASRPTARATASVPRDTGSIRCACRS